MRPPLWVLLALCAACVGAEDTPSVVKDLRVLGMKADPPEIMAKPCQLDTESFEAAMLQFVRPVQLTALIADPAGGGRPVSYELFGCADLSDRACEVPEERVLFAQGTTSAGELSVSLLPATATLPGSEGVPFLQAVYDNDPYKALGGLRVPLVLHLTAGDEEVWAQKLLVYSCAVFAEMEPNVLPALPGVTVDGTTWEATASVLELGARDYAFEPLDFTALEETYVVPSLELQPVQLQERWKIAWHSTLGRFGPNETGGSDLGGQTARHRAVWSPPTDAPEQDVTFWFVVRDGRGGMSWLTRTARYKP